MIIYSSAISPNGKRVRICAKELGVHLEPHFIDFQRGEQRSPEYIALNPMGKVPTLSEGDLVLWESAAILWHLTQTRDSARVLWPSGGHDQADTMRWLFFGACHLDPYYTTLIVERFIKAQRGEPPDEAAAGGAEKWLTRFMPVVEQRLTEREFITGRFGLADIALGCTLELAPIVKCDISAYPNVRAWLGRLQSRESWMGASPEAFPVAGARSPVDG